VPSVHNKRLGDKASSA